jgi:glycine/D-amino acid oxidase-like deaminating enzyme
MVGVDIVVVGGGIIGTMHAFLAVRAGHRVVQLEREDEARGASVRNFGLVWISGGPPARSSTWRCGPASCGTTSPPPCRGSAFGPTVR